MVPIYASSTYVQESPGNIKVLNTKNSKSNKSLYEKCIAELESGKHGFAFASGMSAADAILSLLQKLEMRLLP